MAMRLESIITDFLWLPEADWVIIQKQLDFLSNKFPDHDFSCEHIKQELIKRSNIY